MTRKSAAEFIGTLFAVLALALAPGALGDSTTALPTCKWYGSPTGSTANTGLSPSSPLPLRTVVGKTVAGDVVCLLAGTYSLTTPLYLTRSGTPSARITLRGDYNGTAVLRWTSTTADAMVVLTSGTHHVRVANVVFDGADVANVGVKCNSGGHHLEVLGSLVKNTGAAGIATTGCDYVTLDGNQIHHFGYKKGWSSGISLNGQKWVDTALGFHSFVVNNIVSGGVDESTNHTDGNGIIMDRGGSAPPVLIANNLVYMNGGRCIHTYQTSRIWVVNNTCYKNGLDSRQGTPPEFTAHTNSTDVHFVNNISNAWTNRWPYSVYSSSTAVFTGNDQYEGKISRVDSSVLADPLQLRTANPRFLSPPVVDPAADGQWRNAPAPWLIGTGFHLQSTSSLVNAGIDPRTAPGLTAELRAGVAAYVMRDLEGVTRPQGSGFDLGAYER